MSHNHKTIHSPVEFFAEDIHQTKLADITITPEHIEKAITEIKVNSAAGPDGVPAILVLKRRKSLAQPLCKLWRCSLDTGMIPQLLKMATLCPIYKDGDRSLPKNYRPVPLTSHLINIFEKCARNKIVEHMEDHHLFSDKQHGFRKGRSCLSKLLAHHDWILNDLAEGRNVDVVFLDKVDHGILLHKIKALGITGKLGVWIHAFLTGFSSPRRMRDLSCCDRLKEVGLYSLQRGRDRYRTIYTWKILEGQVPNPALQPYTTETRVVVVSAQGATCQPEPQRGS